MIATPTDMTAGEHIVAGMLVAMSFALMFQKLPDIPDVRRHFYQAGAFSGITLTGAVLAFWGFGERRITEFGLFGWRGDPAVTVPSAIAWGALLVLILWLVKRGWLREWLRKVHLKYEKLMPRSRAELWASWGTSTAAGCGEEIAYRGFLLWYAAAWIGLPAAILAVSLLFGISHGYQSRFGMIFATLAGLLLAGIYVASESLLLVMWMHSTYNMSSFAAGRITLRDEATSG